MDTQKRIELGQAKNQATTILGKPVGYLFPDELEKPYKNLVRLFYNWNKDLDNELLKAEGEADRDETPTHNTEPAKPSLNLPVGSKAPYIPTTLSDKQKRCPVCRKAIPKTWMNHGECG